MDPELPKIKIYCPSKEKSAEEICSVTLISYKNYFVFAHKIMTKNPSLLNSPTYFSSVDIINLPNFLSNLFVKR